MKRRMFALILAAVCALVAGIAVVLYVNGSDERAIAGKQAKRVWVATVAIPRGTSLAKVMSSEKIVQEVVPVESAPATAATDLGTGELVASSDIAAGEIILKDRFVNEKTLGPKELDVPAGLVAAAVSLTESQRVASFVAPGDFVAVFFAPNARSSTSASVLLSRVQVLGVGANSEQGGSLTGAKATPKTDSVLTLAVSPVDAASLTAAVSSGGSLQVVLLPAGEAVAPGTSANLDK